MKRIYIAGCGGMLGEAFYMQFRDEYELKCTDIDVNASWLSYLDFRDYSEYQRDVRKFAPDYLFHLGAYTDLEFCEMNPDETYRTNTVSVENAALIANDLDIPLLYISTAGIFDGQKDVYDDWDLPNPMGVYASTKFQGEKLVIESVNKHLVCRAGWMMGGGPGKDKKFIGKLMRQIEQGARELYIVDDKDGTPTFTHDFARNVKELIQKEHWGLYNMACEGFTSRLEVGTELVKLLNLQDQLTIHSVSSEFFRETYFAKRPPSERLINNFHGI
jgi:dTDP-4-dehydrorhamnose reductase